MKQKKLLLLGGIRYLLPVIEAAHKLGAYVITADYLPDNIAHKYSDEYVNVSILDREAVLKVAQEKKIDGILSFGVDPGVVTAAYVADKMGLPFPPLASVEILQNKDKFRDFLEENGFNCPKRWKPDEEIEYPVIVKPVDSAGSKGCTRVACRADLLKAIEHARSESHSGRIIIEQFIEQQGHQSGSDSFSIDNELVFCTFDSQYFDLSAANPYVPFAHIWPSDMIKSSQNELRSEIQRLIKLLNLGTTIYNIEARVATDGTPYIMEVSPRGGGNRLSEVLVCATHQPIIENNVRGALGLPLLTMSCPKYDGFWVDYIVHSPKPGFFHGVEFDPVFFATHVRECDIYVAQGTPVMGFSGANQAIGTVFMRFDTFAAAEFAVQHSDEWLHVNVN